MESFGWARFGVEVTVSSSPRQVAVANLSEAVQDADLLVFVIPHQFIHRICDEITGRVPKEALGITLIKVTAATRAGNTALDIGSCEISLPLTFISR